MLPGVSVIVCCYNSAKRLPATLDCLAKQSVEGIEWEVVVVDNASTDSTAEVAETFSKKIDLPCPVRVVFEKKPGLTFARKTGLSESKYEFVIFCDDDNWLSPGYVSSAYHILNENHRCAILGGKVVAELETEKPRWFDSYALFYAVDSHPISSDTIISVDAVVGAGMATRRSLWVDVFQKDYKFLCSDRKGKNLSVGGDIEMCELARSLNGIVCYSSRLQLKHFIQKERLTGNYLRKNAFGVGMAFILLQPYKYLHTANVSKWLWFKDFIYVLLELRKPLVRLFSFNKIDFDVELYTILGKLYCLISIRKVYIKNILYIKNYFNVTSYRLPLR